MLAGLAGLVHDRQRDENSHDEDDDQGALHRDLAPGRLLGRIFVVQKNQESLAYSAAAASHQNQ